MLAPEPMLRATAHDPWKRRLWAAVAASVLCSGVAHAHFVLVGPASWANQDALGSPQKSAPCGQADPGAPATPTGMITTYQSGDTLSVTIKETVFHPGHYRLAIAKDQGSLPADPKVTAGATPCGSAEIVASPTLPLLADGELVHTKAFTGNQTMQVKLPPGYTCVNCTLQVIEFMSNHGLNVPGGCFYHHCANVSIVAPDGGASGTDASAPRDAAGTGDAAGTTGDAAGTTGDAAGGGDGAAEVDLGSGGPPPGGAGCACQLGAARSGGAGRAGAGSAGAMVVLLGLLWRRARRGLLRRVA